MSETYMDRLKRDMKRYLRLPEDAEVTFIDEECYYREACPTCGGDYEWSVWVSWVDGNGKRQGKEIQGSLGEFLSDLPLGS